MWNILIIMIIIHFSWSSSLHKKYHKKTDKIWRFLDFSVILQCFDNWHCVKRRRNNFFYPKILSLYKEVQRGVKYINYHHNYSFLLIKFATQKVSLGEGFEKTKISSVCEPFVKVKILSVRKRGGGTYRKIQFLY